MEQNKKNWVKLYIWIFFGILFSIAFALMRTSNTFDKSAFFGQQRVYDFKEEEYTRGTDTCVYVPETGSFIVNGNWGKKNFSKLSTCKHWKYLNMTIQNMTPDYSEWAIYFADAKGNRITQYPITVHNGENVLELQCPAAFQYFGFSFQDQPGLTFAITSMQLRQTQIFYNGAKVIKTAIVTFGLYLFVTFAFWIVRKNGLYTFADFMQRIYQHIGDTCGGALDRHLDIWAKNRLRTYLFWFLFTFMTAFNGFGLYEKSASYKYGMLITTVVIILIGLLSWERPLKKISWRLVLTFAWSALWIWICISDFMVTKFYKFTGYVFLFAVGFFFFIWNNMSHPKQIRNNMIRGLELTFPVFTIYCVLFRQKRDFILYNGVFRSRGEMAGYALILLIAFLAEIYYCLRSKRIKQRAGKIILYGIGVCISIYFLYISWTIVAIGSAALMLLLLLVFIIRNRKNLVMGMLQSAGVLILSAVCGLVAVIGLHMAIGSLPERLNMDIRYSGETLESRLGEDMITILKTENPQVYSGVHSTTRVDKRTIWTNYLRYLNMFGNNGKLTVLGVKTDAHSGYVDMVYRYGLFVLIPYMLLLFCCLYHAWKEQGFLMLATTLAFGMLMLTLCIERPFAHPLWMVFYLGMGIWFGRRKKV